MQNTIRFILDGNITEIQFDSEHRTPTTTVLQYLRSLPYHKGVKEGCAEGDCGACTVVIGELGNGTIRYRNIDSCLMFLPMLHGKQLITVENLRNPQNQLHPVQEAMVETGGSQCGFCTPGIVMSMFSLYRNKVHPTRDDIDDAITGNLCRCTGYKPIAEAAARASVHEGVDEFSRNEKSTIAQLESILHESIHVKTDLQEYFRPASLNEALEIKHKYPDAIVISGSTDAALRVTKGHELLSCVLDLSGIQDLKSLNETENEFIIGAGVVLNDINDRFCEKLPALGAMLSVFGSQQIRNLATLGGNMGTASPISDIPPVLMAYDATIELQNNTEKRVVSIYDYIVGYRTTVRKPNELIIAVRIPKSPHHTIIKSYKISKRKDLDISTVSAGFRLALNSQEEIASLVLAFGGMADRTKRATATEQFLLGKQWTRHTVEEAMNHLENDFTPISDARGSAAFRMIAAKNLLLKFWSETQD